MTTHDFIVQKLTTFAVSDGGTHLHMNFVCEDAGQVSLRLPTECLQGLVMTLPRMMSQALRVRYHDQSLRLVYPAENIRIEVCSDLKTVIVTFATPDGFEVSFSLTLQQMKLFNAAMNDLDRKGFDTDKPISN
jgi:hypothetical protein